jgi:type I restriction enzyme S subunit
MVGEKPAGMDTATEALFPDSMEESELGEIPAGWEVKTLGDVVTALESGKRARGGAQDSGVPSIGAESIRGLGKFDYSSKKFVSEEFYNDLPTGKVRPYDVLVYKDGAGAGSYVSMFGEGFPFEKFAINEHVFLLRSDSLPQSFLYFWLSEKKQKRLMIELAQKSAQPGLNQQDTKSIPILVPSNKVCEAFEEITRPMISYVLKNSKQDKELETLRDTLLPRLISGELQIPEEMFAS